MNKDETLKRLLQLDIHRLLLMKKLAENEPTFACALYKEPISHIRELSQLEDKDIADLHTIGSRVPLFVPNNLVNVINLVKETKNATDDFYKKLVNDY